MPRFPAAHGLRHALLLSCLLSGAAMAQAPLPTPPAEREPNAAAVREAERAAGVAPGAATRAQEAETTDQLYRELTGQNPNAPVAAPTAPPPPPQEARTEDRLYRELTGQSPNAPPPNTPLPGLLPGSQAQGVDQLYRQETGQNPNAPPTLR